MPNPAKYKLKLRARKVRGTQSLNPLRTDPARLATLRRAFLADLWGRFERLKGVIVKKLTDGSLTENRVYKDTPNQAARVANPNPTPAQREAGNYKKGHVVLHGLDITIETPKGIKRKPHHEKPVAWHYGYIKTTNSKADGDHVDVFLGPDPDSELVFVVDQYRTTTTNANPDQQRDPESGKFISSGGRSKEDQAKLLDKISTGNVVRIPISYRKPRFNVQEAIETGVAYPKKFVSWDNLSVVQKLGKKETVAKYLSGEYQSKKAPIAVDVGDQVLLVDGHHRAAAEAIKGSKGLECHVVPLKELTENSAETATRIFDEHKCLLGFTNAVDAKQGYLDSYPDDWQGFGGMRALTLPQFKQWLREGDTGKPIVGQLLTFNQLPTANDLLDSPFTLSWEERQQVVTNANDFFSRCARDIRGWCMGEGGGVTVPPPKPVIHKDVKVEIDKNQYRADRRLTKKLAKWYLGKDHSIAAALVGAQPGAKVKLSATDEDKDRLYISVVHPHYTAERSITVDVHGKKYMHNNEFFLNDDVPIGSGIGTKVFREQVDNLRSKGFSYIKTTAARSDDYEDDYGNTVRGMVGYNLWARLGYDRKLEGSRIMSEAKKAFPKATKLSDLMKTKAGRDWWRDNGRTVNLQFDLTHNSTSLKTLYQYLADKEKEKKGGKVRNAEEKTPLRPREGEEIELTPEDDEILERVWERIREQEEKEKRQLPTDNVEGENCGTGAGGFQPGNTCGRGGSGQGGGSPPPIVDVEVKAVRYERNPEHLRSIVATLVGHGDLTKVAGLVGAQPGATCTVLLGQGGRHIEVETQHHQYYNSRTIGIDGHGNKYVKNDGFSLNDGVPTGTGIGAKVFSDQVEHLRANGFAYIKTYAMRSYDTNGYITWPKLGFDTPLDNYGALGRAKKEFPNAKLLSDLMMTEKGRKWWEKNGESVNLTFDLSHNSRSLQVLSAYKARKEQERRSGKTYNVDAPDEPTPKKPERVEEIELTPDDHEILERVWEKIREEEERKKRETTDNFDPNQLRGKDGKWAKESYLEKVKAEEIRIRNEAFEAHRDYFKHRNAGTMTPEIDKRWERLRREELEANIKTDAVQRGWDFLKRLNYHKDNIHELTEQDMDGLKGSIAGGLGRGQDTDEVTSLTNELLDHYNYDPNVHNFNPNHDAQGKFSSGSGMEKYTNYPLGRLTGKLADEYKEKNRLLQEYEKKAKKEHGFVRSDWPRDVKQEASRLHQERFITSGRLMGSEEGWKYLKQKGYTKDSIDTISVDHLDGLKAHVGGNMGGVVNDEMINTLVNDVLDHYDYDPSNPRHVHNSFSQGTVTNAGEGTPTQQADQFRDWLDREFIAQGILGHYGEQLWKKYSGQGFVNGVTRSYDDTNASKKATAQLPMVARWKKNLKARDRTSKIRKTGDIVVVQNANDLSFYGGAKDQFLRTTLGTPSTKEQAEMLASQGYHEIKGVTDEMKLRLGRTLSDGLIAGEHPKDIARKLSDDVDLSKTRAQRIVQHELSKSFASGQLSALRQLEGVGGVGVIVEWVDSGIGITARGNESPCPECAALAGTTYSLDDAQGVLPYHVGCLCIFKPIFGEAIPSVEEDEDQDDVEEREEDQPEEGEETEETDPYANPDEWFLGNPDENDPDLEDEDEDLITHAKGNWGHSGRPGQVGGSGPGGEGEDKGRSPFQAMLFEKQREIDSLASKRVRMKGKLDAKYPSNWPKEELDTYNELSQKLHRAQADKMLYEEGYKYLRDKGLTQDDMSELTPVQVDDLRSHLDLYVGASENRTNDAINNILDYYDHNPTHNIFCPTGPGGGVKPDCTKEGISGSAGGVPTPTKEQVREKHNPETGKARAIKALKETGLEKHIRSGNRATKKLVEDAAKIVHDEWVKREQSLPGGGRPEKKHLHVPYDKLSEEEKEKDRVFVRDEAAKLQPADHWGGKNQPYWRPGPNPTVDNVITRDGKHGTEVLMIRRADKEGVAERGKWALPGGFHDSDAKKGESWTPGKETAREAALRELKEETGLGVHELESKLKEVGTYEGLNRDPRDNEEAWSRSTAYKLHLPPDQAVKSVTGSDDADKAKWIPVSHIKNMDLAFDHQEILHDAGVIKGTRPAGAKRPVYGLKELPPEPKTFAPSAAKKGEATGAKGKRYSVKEIAHKDEIHEAKKLAKDKIKEAPVPPSKDVAKMRAALQKSRDYTKKAAQIRSIAKENGKTKEEAAALVKKKLGTAPRSGGEARGNAKDRRNRAKNLFDEFGGNYRGYVVCHVTGIKMHYTDDPKENPHGYPKFEQSKIFVAQQGGGYQLHNLIPESFAANRARNKQTVREENVENQTHNIFCRTGAGGGVNPSCSKDEGGGGGSSSGPETPKFMPFGQLHERLRVDADKISSERRDLRRAMFKKYGEEWVNSLEDSSDKESRKFNRLDDKEEELRNKANAARYGWEELKKLGYDKDSIHELTSQHMDKLKTEVAALLGSGTELDDTTSLTNDILDYYDYDPEVHK